MLMEFLLLILLKFLMIICFILHELVTMTPWGWHPPHLGDNTDTQYLEDQHWQQWWCFRFLFFFFFVSICLSMCQSVSVSVHLFTFNLKFLKTHNYWLAQLLNMSLVPRLELKSAGCLSKYLATLPKIMGRFSARVWEKTASSAT